MVWQYIASRAYLDRTDVHLPFQYTFIDQARIWRSPEFMQIKIGRSHDLFFDCRPFVVV